MIFPNPCLLAFDLSLQEMMWPIFSSVGLSNANYQVPGSGMPGKGRVRCYICRCQMLGSGIRCRVPSLWCQTVGDKCRVAWCCVSQSEVPGARRHVLDARLFMPGVRFNMLSAMCHVLGARWQAKVPGGGFRVPGGAARHFLPCARCHEQCVSVSSARWQMPPARCLVPVVSFHVLGARSRVPCASCQVPSGRWNSQCSPP